MSIEILSYRKIDSGALQGSFNILIKPWKLEIRELKYFIKGDNKWINLPSRPYEKDGETKYAYFVCFEEDTRKRFLESCMIALKEYLAKQTDMPEEGFNTLEQEELPF